MADLGRTSPCRSCRAPMVWAQTPAGKRIPLDPEPVDGGNLAVVARVVVRGDTTPVVEVVHDQDSLFDDLPVRYVSHFATCPDADTHRKPR